MISWRLLRAAPDLLRSLQALIIAIDYGQDLVQSPGPAGPWDSKVMREARASVKRALPKS